MVSSGTNTTVVPLGASVSQTGYSFTSRPHSNSARFSLPSRTETTWKKLESALTAFTPTPFMPIDFWKASESYLAPVFILATQSTTFSSGIPRPKSRTVTFCS